MNQDPPLLPEDFPPDPKKWVEFFGSTCLPEPRCDWPRYLLASFGLRPLHSKPGRHGHSTIRLLYAPSFHPECCVTVNEEGNAARVSLVTHCTNLWQWFGHFANEQIAEFARRLPGYNFPPPPRRFHDTGLTDAVQLSEFKRRIPSRLPLEVESRFLDGISLYCEYQKPTGELQSFSRVGEYDPASSKLALAIHKLATDVLDNPESKSILESVRRYL